MAHGGRIRSTLRRLAGIALEDFGLRPLPVAEDRAGAAAAATADDAAAATAETADTEPATSAAPAAPNSAEAADAEPAAAAAPAAPNSAETAPVAAESDVTAAQGLPPGVTWHGAARRRPELQRFCDHLDAAKLAAAARDWRG